MAANYWTAILFNRILDPACTVIAKNIQACIHVYLNWQVLHCRRTNDITRKELQCIYNL